MQTNLRLKEAILKTGRKQYVLSTLAGLNPVRFSKIVSGHLQPNDDEKKRIADVLELPEDELFSH